MKAKVVKNKVAPPFRSAEFDMLGSRGISLEGDVLDLATAERIVQKSGAWFTYGDLRLGQGRDKARQFLEENKKVLEEVRRKVLEQHRHAPAGAVGAVIETNGESVAEVEGEE
jgi:recombination protein RecA